MSLLRPLCNCEGKSSKRSRRCQSQRGTLGCITEKEKAQLGEESQSAVNNKQDVA